MTSPTDKPTRKPINRRVRALKNRIRRFPTLSEKRLDKAICDVIDLRGHALAALLSAMPQLPVQTQKHVAVRLEDVFFFHPRRGVRVFPRLVKAVTEVDPTARPHLIAAIADVLGKTTRHLAVPNQVSLVAFEVLKANIDYMRRSKAVEILSQTDYVGCLPEIIRIMGESLHKIEVFENFHFTETALFAVKRLGGEGLLRLMINPHSPAALTQFRMEWRNRSPDSAQVLLTILNHQEENFAQMLLKVIDLSEFGVPFAAMVTEGLQHSDKWIRQTATASLAKISDKNGLEHLLRMYKDPSLEVRMMAVNSMGSFPASMTGKLLVQIARNEGENSDCRMNALYALFSQKNRAALEAIGLDAGGSVALNAKGLVGLLMPPDDGLEYLLSLIQHTPLALRHELHHYLMEVSKPEDLKKLVALHGQLPAGHHRENFLEFFAAFLSNKSGPALDRSIQELSPAEQLAIQGLHQAATKH